MAYKTSNDIDVLRNRKSSDYLWYDSPAERWLEALPLGNGSIGAMVYGGVGTDRLQLNHDTLYAEEPGRRDLDLDITKRLDEVTGLLASGKYLEADEIVTKEWLGRSWPCYQPAGDLVVTYSGLDDPDNYYRWLDLEKGIHTVSYSIPSGKIESECFASHPDNVLVYKTDAQKGAHIRCAIALESQHPTAETSVSGNDALVMKGKVPGLAVRRTLKVVEERGEQWKYPEVFDKNGNRKENAADVLYGKDIDNLGMEFEIRAQVRTDGKVTAAGNRLSVENATYLEIIAAVATSFNGFDKSPSREGLDPAQINTRTISSAAARQYAELRDRHTTDFSELYNRVSLQLPQVDKDAFLPTYLRIDSAGRDPSYTALYYQFARYLAISGSRPGTQPLNLQGIWNDDIIPPWAGGYTININTQMNYWPAPGGNLIECEEPLINLTEELAVSGKHIAESMYHHSGWVAHHNTTLWRSAQNVDNIAQTSFWPMGSGWLCRHVWDHYLFTCDDHYLAGTALPLLTGASEFYLDWLVEDENGHLLTPVGTSPENAFIYTDEGVEKLASVSSGPTMDIAIIRDCFENTAKALAFTGHNQELCGRITTAIGKLLPYAVAEDGQLKEWNHDLPSFQERHRHLSHLYGAFPAEQITRAATPGLYDAVGRTLDVRGEDSGGWSSSWKANLWARRRDGDRSHRNLLRVLGSEFTNPNLFNGRRQWNDTDGLFQIDGNMGAAAAIMEMLVQSRYTPGEAAEIELLPALPSVWPAGTFSGVRCRGGFEISMEWANAELTSGEITSHAGKPAKVSCADQVMEIELEKGESASLERLVKSG